MDWVWIAALSWIGLSLPLALLIGRYLRGCDQRAARRAPSPHDLEAGAGPPDPAPSSPPHRAARRKCAGTAPVETGGQGERAHGREDAATVEPRPPAGARRRSPLHRHL